MDCPVCRHDAAVRPEPPWLFVRCRTCGTFRITVPAAEVVSLYITTIRQRVSSQLRRAALSEGPLDVDLALLEELARGRTIAGR